MIVRHLFIYRLIGLVFSGLVGFPAGVSAQSQHYVHTALWTRLAPSVTIGKHWLLIGDVYYRRQNDLHKGLANLLNAPLVEGVRLGVTYRTGRWSYQLVPLVFFNNHQQLGKDPDFTRPTNPEVRAQSAVEWTYPLTPKTSVSLRGSYEYRHFLTEGVTNLGRLRFRALVRRRLSEQVYLLGWNETLWYAPPNLPNGATKPFDTNRTYLNLGYTISRQVALEGGYQFSHRRRRSLTEYDEEHALTITMLLRL